MAKSIVISKIRCTSPNRKNTAVQNINHLRYIATRPGVDLTPIKTFADDDASIYLKYITERPRSHGLFGNLPDKKIGDLDALCKEMYQLSKNKVIYKGIVSLNEEDATRLGYTNKESWNSLLNVTMPDIAHEFNIPIQNMSWVAAFHQEKGHPHIHYMLWRDDDKIVSPVIHRSVQNRCRQIFSKYIFEADRELSVAIKTAARNELLDMSKELVGYPELSLESEGVLKITPIELSEVSALLFNLHPLLPKTGRLNYKFLPPEVKKEVDSVIEHILSYPAFESKYCEYVEACKKISASYSVVGKKAEHNLFSAEKDLRTRLANIILKKVKSIPADALIPDKNNIEDTGDIAIESMTQQGIGTQRARRHYDYSEIITPQPNDSHLTSLVNVEEPIVTNINSDKLVALLNTLSNKAEEDELRMQTLYLTALLHLKTDSKHYNIDIALSLLNPLADNGYTSAQASLGSFYLWGKHGRRDIKQGKMWLEKAAEQDYEPAKNQLEIYKNILQNKLIYSSYKLLNSMYTNLVFSSQNKQAYATERATESIKLQKERFRKNQIRSSYLE